MIYQKYKDILEKERDMEIMLGDALINSPYTFDNQKFEDYLEYLAYKLNHNFLHIYNRINKLQRELDEIKKQQNKIENI